MRRRSEVPEVFGLSFLDLISCGLGGVIVLLLVFIANVKGGKAVLESASATMSDSYDRPVLILSVRVAQTQGLSTHMTLEPSRSSGGKAIEYETVSSRRDAVVESIIRESELPATGYDSIDFALGGAPQGAR